MHQGPWLFPLLPMDSLGSKGWLLPLWWQMAAAALSIISCAHSKAMSRPGDWNAHNRGWLGPQRGAGIQGIWLPVPKQDLGSLSKTGDLSGEACGGAKRKVSYTWQGEVGLDQIIERL